MEKIGKKAKIASLNLSNLSIDKRNSVLKQFSHYLKTNEKLILNFLDFQREPSSCEWDEPSS